MKQPADARFPTRNTNLAACLGALRIPIKSPDPCWVVEEAEPAGQEDRGHRTEGSKSRRRVVTYFFEMASAPTDGSEPEQSEKIQWAWNNREKFETENFNHPLVHMRAALDKLGWLVKVWHGQARAEDRGPKTGDGFSTDDINLAACLMASGHDLHSFEKPHFHFSFQFSAFSFQIDDYAAFRTRSTSVAHMRRALECRAILLDLVKRAPTILHYLNGDPMEGGKEGYIAKGATDKNLNIFFELLYE